jgi:hypothetical protein
MTWSSEQTKSFYDKLCIRGRGTLTQLLFEESDEVLKLNKITLSNEATINYLHLQYHIMAINYK